MLRNVLISILLLAAPALADPVDAVRPLLGTGGDGHTFPGATTPFGMVQLSPDTGTTGWEYSSGYRFADTAIHGFSHTHLSGTGEPDFGDILLQPTVGNASQQLTPPPRTGRATAAPPAPAYASAFSHADETASPGYYKVLLKDFGITAELTASPHAGFHKYTFPAADNAHILIDLVHSVGNGPVPDSAITFENDHTVSGYRKSSRWAKNRTTFFVMELSQPFAAATLQVNGAESPDLKTATGTALRAHLDFHTTAGQVVLVKVGISATSLDGARKNLAAEIPGWDFAATAATARKSWNDALSAFTVQAPPATAETFYTALYHALLAPNLFNDADRRYTGADGQIHDAAFQYYSTFSLWDTFRAEHPLLTIAQPARVDDFVNSLLAHADQFDQHTLPVWTLASNETWTMIGYHAVPVIAEAYAKGFRGFDAEKAFAAMRLSAMKNPKPLDPYIANGYIPASPQGRGSTASSDSVSRTLEYAYDDWCIAQMAAALGRKDDAALFTKRSQNFRNVFNADTGFMQPRLADGTFRNPFVPTTFYPDYTEANAWAYTFSVQHDPLALINLVGGDDSFVQKLDQLFTLAPGGRGTGPNARNGIGQYVHGNEPVHHVAYLYNFAGAPGKTAQHVRQVMTTLYSNKPDGLCGNDDCGQMSAWYVFSALGFYPVNPAQGVYVLGSPVVDQATIRLDPAYFPKAKAPTFTIRAVNNSVANMYIQSATLNGQPLEHSYFTHAQLAQGGELVLQMGDRPSEWGTGPSARPQ